jgi:hypothetical protein
MGTVWLVWSVEECDECHVPLRELVGVFPSYADAVLASSDNALDATEIQEIEMGKRLL